MNKTLLIFLLIASKTIAQDFKQTATEHFNNKEWNAAATSFQKLIAKNEADSMDWFNLAFSQMQLADYKQAVQNFNKAKEMKVSPALVDFNLSKIYALQKNSQKMYETLNSGVENGLFMYSRLKTDKAFSEYLDAPDFLEILNKVKLNAYPCLSNADNRHFDFWLGEWDVYVGQTKVGDNSITMAEGGCAIHENYTTAGNYAGQSINFYEPIDKKWHQHWVGSAGDIYNYIETKKAEGFLQFESNFLNQQRQVQLSRLTFTKNPDQTVTQLFENSEDGGQTWSPAFEGTYKRKE